MHRTDSNLRHINITGSKHLEHYGSRPATVKRTGDVSDLRNKYGYNLPTVHQIVANKSVERPRIPSNHQFYNYWHNYGSAPPVVRLLFAGRLPLSFFNDLSCGRHVSSPQDSFKYKPKVNREQELWEPKGKLKKSCRMKDVSVQNARQRHRKRLEQVSERVHEHHKEVESVLLRQRDIMHKGLICFLNKQDLLATKAIQKWKRLASAKPKCSPTKPGHNSDDETSDEE